MIGEPKILQTDSFWNTKKCKWPQKSLSCSFVLTLATWLLKDFN